jgi:heme/copper-type cytochrome/quinol oxidase subunit 4
MNFYFISIIIPIIILLITFYVLKRGVKSKKNQDIFVISLILISFYALILYLLTMENIYDSGWAFYSILFFTIPILFVTLTYKLYLKFKK